MWKLYLESYLLQRDVVFIGFLVFFFFSVDTEPSETGLQYKKSDPQFLGWHRGAASSLCLFKVEYVLTELLYVVCFFLFVLYWRWENKGHKHFTVWLAWGFYGRSGKEPPWQTVLQWLDIIVFSLTDTGCLKNKKTLELHEASSLFLWFGLCFMLEMRSRSSEVTVRGGNQEKKSKQSISEHLLLSKYQIPSVDLVNQKHLCLSAVWLFTGLSLGNAVF